MVVQPIDVGAAQYLVGRGVRDAALRELGANALRALALGHSRAHERFREARIGERAHALELVQDGSNDVVREAASAELARQLAAAVLAPRQ